jgi:hypothetical protein
MNDIAQYLCRLPAPARAQADLGDGPYVTQFRCEQLRPYVGRGGGELFRGVRLPCRN